MFDLHHIYLQSINRLAAEVIGKPPDQIFK